MDKVCGLDVHKDSVFACILDEKGKKILEECYGVLTPDLDKLRDVLVNHGVGRERSPPSPVTTKVLLKVSSNTLSNVCR